MFFREKLQKWTSFFSKHPEKDACSPPQCKHIGFESHSAKRIAVTILVAEQPAEVFSIILNSAYKSAENQGVAGRFEKFVKRC